MVYCNRFEMRGSLTPTIMRGLLRAAPRWPMAPRSLRRPARPTGAMLLLRARVLKSGCEAATASEGDATSCERAEPESTQSQQQLERPLEEPTLKPNRRGKWIDRGCTTLRGDAPQA